MGVETRIYDFLYKDLVHNDELLQHIQTCMQTKSWRLLFAGTPAAVQKDEEVVRIMWVFEAKEELLRFYLQVQTPQLSS